MSQLRLTQELAERFAAALCAVIRANQEIGPSEGRAVQEAIDALLPGMKVDLAEALLMPASPESFANAVRAASSTPYRGQSISTAGVIAKAFERAAIQVASADGQPTAHEKQIIQRYLDALAMR